MLVELANATPFAGMTRIRFDGCDLSPDRGTPVRRSYASIIVADAAPSSADSLLAGRGARLPQPRSPRARRARPRSRPSSTRACATAIGVDSLYLHQLAAWDAAARGEHLVVTTGTASGKTLAFNLPVLDALARTPKNRVLYLYPTKALAQDQFRTLNALRVPRLRPAIYDGDTPTEQRWQIRKWSNAILTNPDMVHIGLLPNHERWGEVLANLRYVVVDEAHVYRGVFGSHVANVLRRLRRHGAHLRLRAAVPARHGDDREPGRARARRCSERRSTVIGDDAAPRAERTVVLWNPPLLDAELGLRGSALAEAAKLQAGLRRARPADVDLREEPQGGRARPPLHRRAARRRLAPLALPRRLHGRAAARDRAAARRGRPARRLLDRRARARDRHRPARRGDLGRLPRARSPRCASSGAAPGGEGTGSPCSSRPRTRSTSTSCASRTSCSAAASRRRSSTTRTRASSPAMSARPRTRRRSTTRDAAILGAEALAAAAADPELRKTPRGFVWAGTTTPAARVALRSADPDSFTVVDGSTGSVLGHVERSRAYSTVHEGAVYLHGGESYLVRELDETTLRAVVEPFRGDWYTQPKRETETDDARAAARGAACSGSTSCSARSR